MRSGFCSGDDAQHSRCRMKHCSCPQHDQDVKDRAAALMGDVFDGLRPDPIRDYVRATSDAAHLLSIAATEVGERSAEDCLRLLHDLRASINLLKDVDAALVQRIYLAGEHGDVRVDGLPPAKVTRGRDRKEWDARGAVFAYLDSVMSERQGELMEPSAVADLVMEVLPANSSTACKVTALKARGIDPKDYCTETPGRLAVTFVQ